MRVQAILKIRGMDIEKTIRKIECERGVCREVLYTQGHTHHVCEIPSLEGVTIQLFERTINVYYDDERYSIQYIQECLRKLIVDKEGKPVELTLEGVNLKVRQRVKGIIGLVSEPLEMISPSGIVVSVGVKSGTLTASVVPAGSSVWEPLFPRNSTLGTCIGTLCIPKQGLSV